MTKKELVCAIALNVGVTQAEANKLLVELSKCIIDECHNNGEISLPGIGKFTSKHKPSREVRNPRTNAMIMSKAKNVPVFKASSNFKKGLN